MTNKSGSHTKFTGIKYSNNPLTTDKDSFTNANNVYLNKYDALISRPPINITDYPYQAYSDIAIIPEHLKIVGLHNLSNGGVVYTILNLNTNLYTLRYKSPLDKYSDLVPYKPPEVIRHTVKFNSIGAGTIADQIIEPDGLVIEPEEPTKADNTFLGWSNVTLASRFSFDTPIKFDRTLYAKWEPIDYGLKWYEETLELFVGYEGELLQVSNNMRLEASITASSDVSEGQDEYNLFTIPVILTSLLTQGSTNMSLEGFISSGPTVIIGQEGVTTVGSIYSADLLQVSTNMSLEASIATSNEVFIGIDELTTVGSIYSADLLQVSTNMSLEASLSTSSDISEGQDEYDLHNINFTYSADLLQVSTNMSLEASLSTSSDISEGQDEYDLHNINFIYSADLLQVSTNMSLEASIATDIDVSDYAQRYAWGSTSETTTTTFESCEDAYDVGNVKSYQSTSCSFSGGNGYFSSTDDTTSQPSCSDGAEYTACTFNSCSLPQYTNQRDCENNGGTSMFICRDYTGVETTTTRYLECKLVNL